MATYEAYWKQNERNVIVVTSTSGSTNMWLNGTQILTNNASAWTPKPITTLHIGSNVTPSSRFDGTIHSFKIFNKVLTAEDAQNYSDNNQFDYRNRASIDLPMGAEQHDVTNVKTLDVVGTAHATFGDGTTASTYPTKLTKHGYDFDGGDYLTMPVSGIFDSTKYSIVMEFYPDFPFDQDANMYFYDTTDSRTYLAHILGGGMLVGFGNLVIASITGGTIAPAWKQGQRNVLILTGDSSNNLTNIWLNDTQILTDDTTAWASSDITTLTIGDRAILNLGFDGKITGFQVYPFLLSAVQREDILINSQKKENNI